MNNALHQVFKHTIQDIYNSEKQITAALPKMIGAAQNPDLAQALQSHLAETQTHVQRIEEVCQMLGFETGNVTCQGTAGLIREAQEQMEEFGPGPAGDVAIIASCQKVEHYEISNYGSVIEWAELMDLDDAVDLLKETLKEEKAADDKLNKIAKKTVNETALEAVPVGSASKATVI
jgi:ferritin-like metal-binding protein YciE